VIVAKADEARFGSEIARFYADERSVVAPAPERDD
jgi:hypothetical protein